MGKRRLFWLSVFILYAVTWIGGWLTCVRDLRKTTWARYQRTREVVDRQLPLAREAGADTRFLEGALFSDGPKYSLWCIPILPGVILVDYYAQTGPLFGGGGMEVRFYYGFGSGRFFQGPGWSAVTPESLGIRALD